MKLSGVFAPIPTPFDGDDRLDTKRLQAALAKWLAHPLAGFVVLGTTGEAQLLADDESDRAIAAAREVVPKDRLLIAGTGREFTSAAAGAAKRAADLGADAVLVRTPGVFKNQMTDEAFVRHYSTVADASTVPVILYNFPLLTGVRLSTAVVARLAGHQNIIGMKDSSGDVQQIPRFVACAPAGFSVLSGSGSTFHGALIGGASGGILALSCVLPEACARLFELTQSCQYAEARALQERLLTIAKLVGSTYGVPALKAAVQLAGYDVGLPRPPLPPAPEHVVAELREALRSFEEVPAG